MILITGGLGFIGLHTARAVLDAGEQVVLTQYRVAREPEFIKDALGKQAFVEQLDVTDPEALQAIGRRHAIDGIIHLAAPGLGALEPAEDYRVNMFGLLHILEAARTWAVKRLSIASSIAVYQGVQHGPFYEDMALRLAPGNPTETFKKAYEVTSWHYAERTGLDLALLRISGIYGPLYHSMSNLPSRLVHAAVKGEAPDLRGQELFEEDGQDFCYVKDCAQGIALVQTAASLPERVYNISLGRETQYGELAAAIRAVTPDADLPLHPGRGPHPRERAYCDISRLRRDTGFEPQWPAERAIPDYIEWLRGHAE